MIKVNKLLLSTISVVVFLIVVGVLIAQWKKNSQQKTYFKYSAQYNDLVGGKPHPTFKEALDSMGWKNTESSESAKMLFLWDFTDYPKIRQRVKMWRSKNKRIVFGFNTINTFADKSALSVNLRTHLSTGEYNSMMPKTFSLYLDSDIQNLLNYVNTPANSKKLFIFKKNKQRQNNIIIKRGVDVLQGLKEKEYVVCQELLQNPLRISGHKINIRVYLVCVCNNGVFDMYVFNNGFIYYAPDKFIKDSTKLSVNITTGYVDRKIYEENPLTIADLNNRLGEDSFRRLFSNITKTFSNVKRSYESIVSEGDCWQREVIKFTILGADIAPDEDMNVKIMEINKGPDLRYKDDRDKEVKLALVKECLKLVTRGHGYSKKQAFIKL